MKLRTRFNNQLIKADQYLFQAYILNKTNVGSSVVKPKKVNTARDGKNSIDMVEEYMKELSKDERGPELLQGLCQLYKIDFKVFGYHYEDCGF